MIIKKTTLSSLVFGCSLILLSGCINSTDTTNQSDVSSQEVKQDLQTMASAVTSLNLGTKKLTSNNPSLQKKSILAKKSETSDPLIQDEEIPFDSNYIYYDDTEFTDDSEYLDEDCTTTDLITVCNYSETDPASTNSDTTFYLAADGETLINELEYFSSFTSSFMVMNSGYISDLYTGWIHISASIKDASFENMEMTGNGWIHYTASDFLLEIPSISATSNSDEISISYQITLMDQKYHCTLSDTQSWDDAEVQAPEENTQVSTDPEQVFMQGDILNSNNEKVGTLQILESDDVIFLDLDGNVVKSSQA